METPEQDGTTEETYPIPAHLLSKLTPLQRKSIRPESWTIIKKVYDFCREHEEPESSDQTRHNGRYSAAHVMKKRNELALAVESMLTEKERLEWFRPPEHTVLLSAFYNTPLNVDTVTQDYRLWSKTEVAAEAEEEGQKKKRKYKSFMLPAEDNVRTENFPPPITFRRVRYSLHMPVRPRGKNPKAERPTKEQKPASARKKKSETTEEK